MKIFTKCIVALLTSLFLIGCLAPARAVYAASPSQVTLTGTIIRTREYYNVNGDVNVYGFFPVTLTTVKVGGKNVELYECGVGIASELGTNNLDTYCGVIKQYTGTLCKSNTKPYSYTFVISSVSDPVGPLENNGTAFTTYLTGLGFTPDPIEANLPYPFHAGGRVAQPGGFIDFHYYSENGIYGTTTVNVMKDDFSYEFGAVQVGMNYAKAQYVAKLAAGYANGTVKKKTLQAFLPQ